MRNRRLDEAEVFIKRSGTIVYGIDHDGLNADPVSQNRLAHHGVISCKAIPLNQTTIAI